MTTSTRGGDPTAEAGEEASARVIRRASLTAAGLAVVLSPIPFADEAALLPLYARMALRIARARGLRARDLPWRPLTKAALGGLALRAGVNAPVAIVPGVAAAFNAATAFGLTTAYGAYVDHLCAPRPSTMGLDPAMILAGLRASCAPSRARA